MTIQFIKGYEHMRNGHSTFAALAAILIVLVGCNRRPPLLTDDNIYSEVKRGNVLSVEIDAEAGEAIFRMNSDIEGIPGARSGYTYWSSPGTVRRSKMEALLREYQVPFNAR